MARDQESAQAQKFKKCNLLVIRRGHICASLPARPQEGAGEESRYKVDRPECFRGDQATACVL